MLSKVGICDILEKLYILGPIKRGLFHEKKFTVITGVQGFERVDKVRLVEDDTRWVDWWR